MLRCALHISSYLLACFALASPSAAQAPAANGYEAICKTLSGNAGSDETICEGFQFNDGQNDIAAGLAATSKSDFNDSLWRLTDGVRLTSGATEIRADQALLRFEANQLVQSELSGSPVVISDFIEERNIAVRGTAQAMSYDRRSRAVHLTGQATLRIGENEVVGCEWIYNVIDKTYGTGTSSECDEGIRLLLTQPEESNDPAGQTEAP